MNVKKYYVKPQLKNLGLLREFILGTSTTDQDF